MLCLVDNAIVLGLLCLPICDVVSFNTINDLYIRDDVLVLSAFSLLGYCVDNLASSAIASS